MLSDKEILEHLSQQISETTRKYEAVSCLMQGLMDRIRRLQKELLPLELILPKHQEVLDELS